MPKYPSNKVHPFQGDELAPGVCFYSTQPSSKNMCGKAPGDDDHRRTTSSLPYTPLIQVEVYVGSYEGHQGMHHATVAYKAEGLGSWFSAWFAPHNEPKKWRRLVNLDTWSLDEAVKNVGTLASRRLTRPELNSMGITSA